MDLANLNAFIAIAETGSFSGAAERLFLTQPAISKRIAITVLLGAAASAASPKRGKTAAVGTA